MKTERRHELQTNVLADWLGGKLEAARQYTKAIVASLVALVVIVGVVVFLSKRSEQKQATAWEQYFNVVTSGASEQLGTVADKYPDTLAGQWARLSLGDSELAQGTSQLFDDRTLAKGTLERAVESYTRIRQDARDAEILERATLGLARAHEALSELNEAQQEYEQLLAKWPQSIYAAEARQRLDDISRQSTKEFYDWFAMQNSKPLDSPGAGIPGVKPSGLPDEEPAKATTPETKPPAEKPAPSSQAPATKPDTKAAETPAKSAPKATGKSADEKPAGDQK